MTYLHKYIYVAFVVKIINARIHAHIDFSNTILLLNNKVKFYKIIIIIVLSVYKFDL